jgi:hypothetical protein
MKKSTLFILLVVLAIIIVGGWYAYNSYQSGSWSSTGSTTGTPSSANSLTLSEMENATYDVGNLFYFSDHPQVTLVNGAYADTAQENFGSIRRNVSLTTSSAAPLAAFGDLNGDGAGDAAVILNVSYADASSSQPASPQTDTLLEVFLNGNANASEPILVATSSDFSIPPVAGQPSVSGQRLSTITSITITNGIVSVFGTADSDGSSASSTALSLQYKLVSGILVKIGQAFAIPTQGGSASQQIGAGQSWTTYTSSAGGFQFDYPASSVDAYTNSASIQGIKSYLPINPEATVVLTLPPNIYPAKTTLKEAAMVFSVTSTPDLKTCISQAAGQSGESMTPVEVPILPPNADPANPQGSAVDFYQVPNDYGGCWAGGCAYGTLFATYQNNTCYQIGLQAAVTDPGALYSTTAGVLAAEAVNTSFEQRLSVLFDQIISTIEFK